MFYPEEAEDSSASFPAIHVISDSIGITAQTIARVATSQFGVPDPVLEVLSGVNNIGTITDFLDEHSSIQEAQTGDKTILCFYTLVEGPTYDAFQDYLARNPHVVAVDLLSNALNAISKVSGLEPDAERGVYRATDEAYYRRIEAMEFAIEHDDGRNPQDLTKADIVLLGVSRSSKTPTSIYLSQEGYKVSNVPLDPSTDPPKEVFDVEPSRLFGLMISPEVLLGIRQRRLTSAEKAVAGEYANIEFIERDLEKSRALMRRLGCIVVHTDNRAVEETAQEILRYYEMAHPRT
ncbi:MAG: kinase/pyrophosphorylase [Eggerthellaceae bacterium]|nr:kinase/pyrophosphorylase [Eggerthellaceae bacterium]